MYWLGMTEGVPIESKLISKRIENAQKAVEAQNFEARKHLLEYDDVMNKQRETIYSLRRSFLEGRDQKEFVLERAEAIVNQLVETYCPREQHPDQWNVTQFSNEDAESVWHRSEDGRSRTCRAGSRRACRRSC